VMGVPKISTTMPMWSSFSCPQARQLSVTLLLLERLGVWT
jgi:hypothetical protein